MGWNSGLLGESSIEMQPSGYAKKNLEQAKKEETEFYH